MENLNPALNPYDSPEADLEVQQAEEYPPKIFSFNGRIGRARYIAYGFLGNLILSVFIGIGVGISAVMPDDGETLALIVMVLGYIPLLVMFVAWSKRRFNDRGTSGWAVLLTLVPIVNFATMVMLIFLPGNPGINRFGPPAVKNTAMVYFALVMGFVFMLGIVAAIALPAYQSYVTAAGG